MKPAIAIVLLLVACCKTGITQTIDTVRTYNYETAFDAWQLQINSDKTFRLTLRGYWGIGDSVITGKWKKEDNEITFFHINKSPAVKNLARKELKQFSNIPYIVGGGAFGLQNNLLLPHNIQYPDTPEPVMPEGIFARYYMGDGWYSYIVELKGDNTYSLYEQDCLSNAEEQGSWALENDVVSFLPVDKKLSLLNWVTQNNRLFITSNYLVGCIVTRHVKQGKTIFTEVYNYLAKQPERRGEY